MEISPAAREQRGQPRFKPSPTAEVFLLLAGHEKPQLKLNREAPRPGRSAELFVAVHEVRFYCTTLGGWSRLLPNKSSASLRN